MLGLFYILTIVCPGKECDISGRCPFLKFSHETHFYYLEFLKTRLVLFVTILDFTEEKFPPQGQ